jgi:NADH:ubiquinone reductase (non-electrogenic)
MSTTNSIDNAYGVKSGNVGNNLRFHPKPNITIIGFGWGSIGFLQDIDTDKYNITVISDKDSFVYTPLLAQNVKHARAITIPISKLNKLIHYQHGRVNDVDFQNKTVITDDAYRNPFDYIIFAHGSDVNTFGIPGVKEHTLYLKTAEYSQHISDRISKLHTGASVVVIGCGLAGTELIGTLIDYNKFKVIAVDALDHPLPTFDSTLSQRVIDLWAKEGVTLHFKSMVSKIRENTIDIKDKNSIPFDLAIWCGGIKANDLTMKINNRLKLDCPRGIPVDERLIVRGTNKIFAIGDCAFSGNPPTAQVAYQQGKYLAKQFNSGATTKNVFKYDDHGQIGYIGRGQSVYQINGFRGGGKLIYMFNNLVHLYNFGSVYINNKWTKTPKAKVDEV